MKEIWLTPREIAGKYNCPKTVQGVALRAKAENWEKRKAKGKKGGGFEYEVSNIINKFELLQNHENSSDNKLQGSAANYNVRKVSVDEDFFKGHTVIGELKVDTSNIDDIKISTDGAAWIILSNEFVERQGLSNVDLATFTATDDSMSDAIKNGDTLLVSIHNDSTEQAKALGGIYIILFNGVIMVKRLQYNPVDVSYSVISDNQNYQAFTVQKEDPNFKVIAKLERVLSKR
ncbi:hypothetical protein A9G45_09800 [Gilliamella sp. HK2]|uniref:S24 family peptidase n=1 Tax=unclassified Gilliamella TaxID=2685620 RepID=UPI00080D92D9|nr:S24 family peptidase [Gilliamella apicola]OCG27213.1 hypothetical protein A9G45_09800 [Gilliamella apicola]OCG29233.1 hypothetical protein A9G46_00690 [Gilliamella apicola]